MIRKTEVKFHGDGVEVANEAFIPLGHVAIDQPEKKLYLAVLLEALRDLEKKEQYPSAYRWLTNTTDNRTLSLNWICGAIGYDAKSIADAVRNGIRIPNWKMWMNGYSTKVCGAPQIAGKNW